MRLFRFRRNVKAVMSLVGTLAFCLFFWLLGKFQLPSGANEEEYYLYSPSSQAEIKKSAEWSDLTFTIGESKGYKVENADEFVRGTLDSLNAKVLFCEEVCGVRSYYCYSPRFGAVTYLNGYPVNLHVAAQGNVVKIGTPVIFGGY